jgi:hypothetical protein
MSETVDEVTNNRTNARGGLSRRPVEEETVSMAGGPAKVSHSGIEDETHEGDRRGRAYPKVVEDLLAKFEKEGQDARTPDPHEEGDADEDEEAAADEASDVAAAGADEPASGEAAEGDGDEEGGGKEEGDDKEGTPDPVAETRAANETLTKRNQELLSELEVARKTPKTVRTERETALVAAEAAYIEEGSVPALRKFLGIVTGAAPDSKEVDAELAGLYADLTSRELGVPLDDNQRTLRDNARTRLLLARDKREKVDADKKPADDNTAADVQYGEATKFVDNLLSTKTQSGTSLADEYPMLMTLAQDFDGYTPSEVIARAIRQEIMTGTLDPKDKQDVDLIRAVAPKIEKHYDAVAKKIEAMRAQQKKSGITPSAEPKAAVEASKEPRQSPGARTITNAAASRAPAKLPKATVVKGKTTGEKTRKDFPSEAGWKDYLFHKHFKS